MQDTEEHIRGYTAKSSLCKDMSKGLLESLGEEK
jgi:hypothetical protein